uniref:Leucine rich immune protein (Coil-less) n=1 Tax=Anopheles farauti TaxID=69004 RepID=A0A182QPB3_9DIPT
MPHKMKLSFAGLLLGVTLNALVSYQPTEAALCMCHPSSCVFINANSSILATPELYCSANMVNASDLLLLRYKESSLGVDALSSFTKLTSIDIFHGLLSRIEPGAFEKVPELTKIFIRNNLLTTVEDYTFRGLDALEILYLIANDLTTIAPHAFHGLKSLTHLVLSGNKLVNLPPTMLSASPLVRFISLNNNELTELPAGLFNNVNNLFRLDLSYNRLQSFDFPELQVALLFLQNNSLTSLNLGDHMSIVQADQNRIATILGTGANVTSLLLSDNAITDVTPITRMTNITKLSLSNNPLLPGSVFSNMGQLRELLLSHTNIQITERTFANLSWLTMLDLSYNNLTELDFKLFSPMVELRTLIVAYNRIPGINFIELREYLPELRVLEVCGNGWNSTYLEHVLGQMRRYHLQGDMQGIAHSMFFSTFYVELCSTASEAPTKPTTDDTDYYSEDLSELDQDIAEYFPSSTPSPTTELTVSNSRPVTTTTTVRVPGSVVSNSADQPSVAVRLNTVEMNEATETVKSAEQQPVLGSSPMYVTFQVLVYTFSVFGIVCLIVLGYYARQRRFDVRRITSDSVRLV